MLGLYEYIKIVERITYYSVMPEADKSKDYLYTVTAMLAEELARLAGSKEMGSSGY